MKAAVQLMLMGLGVFGLVCALTRCMVPVSVAAPLFTTAAIAGAGAAVGAGAVDISWAHLPTTAATPAAKATADDVATPTPQPTTEAEK